MKRALAIALLFLVVIGTVVIGTELSVIRNQASTIRELSKPHIMAEWYGVSETNDDNSVPLQNAIDALKGMTGGGTLYFPCGVIRVAGGAIGSVTNSALRLYGPPPVENYLNIPTPTPRL